MEAQEFLKKIKEFERKYGYEAETHEHPLIVQFLYCKGREIIVGTKGIESEEGGNLFLNEDGPSTIPMRSLWLIREADGEYITRRQMSHYLGKTESYISSKLNEMQKSTFFQEIIGMKQNGGFKYFCKNKEAFPDTWDAKGYKELEDLIYSTIIETVKDKEPALDYNRIYVRHRYRIDEIIHHIKSYDGNIKDMDEKYIEKNLKQIGITATEMAEIFNDGSKEKRDKILDDLRNLTHEKVLGEYVKFHNFDIDGEPRYYMTAEGRYKTLQELKQIANDSMRKLNKAVKAKKVASV